MNDFELDEILNAWHAPAVPPSLRARLHTQLPAPPRRSLFGLPARWLAAVACGAGVLALAASLIENGVLSSDAGAWDSSTYVRRTRVVEPPIARLKWMAMGGHSTGWRWEGDKLAGSVYLYNRFTHAHYGYTWNARPVGPGRYLFTVLPLDASALRENGSIVPLAQLPPPRVVAQGQAFDVNLYASGHERVYDHIQLGAQTLPPMTGKDTLALTLSNPKLYINGKLVADSGGVAEASGRTIFVSLPGRGSYVLALDPKVDARFRPAGSANGSTIEFESGGDQFRIECSGPVASEAHHPVFLLLQKDVRADAPRFGSGYPPRR